MGVIKRMKLSDIKISESFANTTPIKKKMEECRNYWNKYHNQDRYVVVNHNGVLVDGYIQYLILKENGVEEASIIRKKNYKRFIERNPTYSYKNSKTTYIFGIHPNSSCTKEFCWRVPASWRQWAENIEVGDIILCQTKFGFSPVIVNRVEVLDKPPIEMRVKKVAKRVIRRNGLVIEI